MGGTGANPPNAFVQQAMGSITWLERHLWGWAVKRAFWNPSSRWYSLIPDYGARGATHRLMAGLWVLPGVLLVVGGTLVQFHSLGPVVIGLGWAVVAIALFSLGFMFVRINSSWRARKKWHGPGGSASETG
jgi:hypothetical protein